MLVQLVQIGTLISIIGGVVGLVIGVIIFRRQTQIQMFLEYTKRYREVMDSLPRQAISARLQSEHNPPEPTEELTLAVLKYLNLCSEEYYLWQQKYLSAKVWHIWEDEMIRVLRTPLVQREWAELQSEFQAYPDFCGYVDSKHIKIN